MGCLSSKKVNCYGLGARSHGFVIPQLKLKHGFTLIKSARHDLRADFHHKNAISRLRIHFTFE